MALIDKHKVLERNATLLLAGIAIVGIDALGPEGVAPFIYFQF